MANNEGEDVTEEFCRGAAMALETAKQYGCVRAAVSYTHLVILYQALLHFNIHAHDPPLRVRNHNFFYTGISGCICHDKNLFRRQMPGSQHSPILPHKAENIH